MVRTLACHARGRRFEPVPGRHFPFAFVAQLVEQRTENPRVVGSIPTGGTIFHSSTLESKEFASDGQHRGSILGAKMRV